MEEPAARRSPRAPRRGYDIHQTHFFYRDDLAAGATVVDHVTGEPVGQVREVGRHVFEGHGAPSTDGGSPGDLVVEVVELEPVVPVRMPSREPRPSGGVRRGVDPQGEETVTVDLDRDDHRAVDVEPVPAASPAPSRSGIADAPDDQPDDEYEDEDEDDPEPTARFHDPDEDDDDADDSDGAGGRRVTGATVAQGVAVLVLAPLLALVLLVVLLVVLVG